MKRGKHPTSKRRNHKQTVKERYSKAREDAQLTGLIPTEPVGAVRSERVDPSTQDDPTDHLSLVVVAARNNWATPDDVKPRVVDNLAKIATGGSGETLLGKDGEVIDTGPSLKTQVYAAKVLAEIDQVQYERDNPRAKGPAVGVNVGVQLVDGREVTIFGEIKSLVQRAREQFNERESTDAGRRGTVVCDGVARGEVEANPAQ